MTTFKPGDRVRRVVWGGDLSPVGTLGTVVGIQEDTRGIYVDQDTGNRNVGWSTDYAELVIPAPSEPEEGELKIYIDGSWLTADESWDLVQTTRVELDEFKAKVVEVVNFWALPEHAQKGILKDLGLLKPFRYRVTLTVEADDEKTVRSLLADDVKSYADIFTVEKIEEES